MSNDGLEVAIAKAIFLPFSKSQPTDEVMIRLRDIAWLKLTVSQQEVFLNEARSVIKLLRENEMLLGMIAEGFNEEVAQ